MDPRRLLLTGLAAATALAGSGCVHEHPAGIGADSVYRDTVRVAKLRTEAGWSIDEKEAQDSIPAVMESVCRATPEARSEALAWLDQRIEALGGDPRAVWLAEGKKLGKVEDLLLATRTRTLLANALTLAPHCPFYLEPREDFRGVHTDNRQFVLYAEGGGRFVVSNLGSRLSVGGVTGARIFAGYGVNHDLTLLLGVEGSASAQFDRGDKTIINNQPRVVTSFGLPIIVRNTGLATILDVEVAPTLVYTEVDDGFAPGLRLGLGYGAATTRVRGFMPLFSGFLSVEASVRPDGTKLFLVSAGGRGGIDWTPFQ
jgi:hypothetical protein